MDPKCLPSVQQLAELCLKKGITVAVAESCTGGGLAYYLTAVPGSSQWFDRGFVTYTGAAKQVMLSVPESTLLQHGEVSQQTAAAMARGVLAHSQADIATSITGIAGPGGATEDKPVGLVWFACARRDGEVYSEAKHFDGDRAEVRLASIEFALQLLNKYA